MQPYASLSDCSGTSSAVEVGDLEKVDAYIASQYTLTGTIPFPVSLFVKITKKDALLATPAYCAAYPSFRVPLSQAHRHSRDGEIQFCFPHLAMLQTGFPPARE